MIISNYGIKKNFRNLTGHMTKNGYENAEQAG
jgi:hypothetical protein